MNTHEAQREVANAAHLKLVGIRAVCDLTSLSRATIYRLVGDEQFPRALKISANRIAWREQAVLDWLASRSETARDCA
jgi:prophage regulatory protein